MDVMGRNPTSKEGGYFRNNCWWWSDLASYCQEVAPDVTAQCRYWHSNDGDGLDGRNSLLLADLLQREIDSGRCKRWAEIRASELERLPNEPCSLCEGTGTRKPVPECGAGDLATGIICNACDGEGYVRPLNAVFRFAVENVQEFVTFLRASGGFEIW
jgi:hypothetical protein